MWESSLKKPKNKKLLIPYMKNDVIVALFLWVGLNAFQHVLLTSFFPFFYVTFT